jgi:hypothetical protein
MTDDIRARLTSYKASRPVPDDAPVLDQVLALAGRDLTWTRA